MKRIVFWFDVISPFVHLAFERLPQVLEGCSYEVAYRPLLLAALLQYHGQKGPAEIDSKRAWTFRHVHWLARQHGITMATPLTHPFNPLALQRLALACAPTGGLPNRRVVQTLLAHVWHGGADANDAARLDELRVQLAPQRDAGADEIKAELRAHSDEAIARGVFGVPSFELDGRLFWGLDSLPMLRAALRGEPWFDGPDWQREGAPRAGITRG